MTRGRREIKLLAYLAQRAPAEERRRRLTAVHELVRTNNAVLITAIEALLKSADIPHMVLDQHMSVLEGSLGMLPRRIVVDQEYWEVARSSWRTRAWRMSCGPDRAVRTGDDR